jgi:hypothetical protein
MPRRRAPSQAATETGKQQNIYTQASGLNQPSTRHSGSSPNPLSTGAASSAQRAAVAGRCGGCLLQLWQLAAGARAAAGVQTSTSAIWPTSPPLHSTIAGCSCGSSELQLAAVWLFFRWAVGGPGQKAGSCCSLFTGGGWPPARLALRSGGSCLQAITQAAAQSPHKSGLSCSVKGGGWGSGWVTSARNSSRLQGCHRNRCILEVRPTL